MFQISIVLCTEIFLFVYLAFVSKIPQNKLLNQLFFVSLLKEALKKTHVKYKKMLRCLGINEPSDNYK